jgi:low temperature requirement protein LtrA
VVVLIAQAARRLAGHLDWSGLGQFAVVFTLVWIAWANGSLHYELHGREDARSRITFLVQILVLAVMGACIPAASGARGAAFAVATAVLFAILAGLWLRAGRGDRPEYRRSTRLYVAGTVAFAVLMACTALLPAGARVPAWGLLDAAYLAVFGAVILTASAGASLIVTDALIERFGTLTIIVLGEILTSAVAGLASQPLSGLSLSVGLVAVVVGFGAWWTYFDFTGQRQPKPTRPATAQWMLGHLPLTASIAAMGAAMVSLINHAHDSRTPVATAWVLCAGAAVVLCATILVSASLQARRGDPALHQLLTRSCIPVAAACLGVGAARPAPLLLCVALVLLLGVPWVLAVAHHLAETSGSPSE